MTPVQSELSTISPWFIATGKFDKTDAGWEKYIAWSHLDQLDEVVSLDPILCPTTLPEIKTDYWTRIVNEDFMLHFFTDVAYLRSLILNVQRKNLLCVFRNPAVQQTLEVPVGFKFLGYDLVDIQGSASALTNCGGFPEAFSKNEISEKGLLTSFQRARQVQTELREKYPKEIHADCHLWAIYREA
jgi:hypothetical protein